MPNQEESRDGIPRKDKDRPSPSVGRDAPDGQASARGTGLDTREDADHASERPRAGEKGAGVNERDHGAADDKPMAGGALDFDDGTDMVHPRGKVTSAGRTWNEKNPSDAGELGAPGAGLSDRNGPSDPDAKRNR